MLQRLRIVQTLGDVEGLDGGEGVGGHCCGGRWRARGCFLTIKLLLHVLGELLHCAQWLVVQSLGLSIVH